jgi:predicted small integral membrane protein
VSPILIVTAVLAYIGAIVFDLYAHDFDVSWGHDTVQRAIVMTVTNALLAVVGIWNLYGRKLNPHQSADDRFQILSINLKSLFLISTVLSAFIAVSAADDIYNLDAFDAVIMSIYFQVIALFSIGYSLYSIKPEEIDFDVYKKEAATV